MAQQWNADGNYYYDDSKFDASGNTLPAANDWGAWLGNNGLANAKGYGTLSNYMSGLSTNYGLGADDFTKALQSYGVNYQPTANEYAGTVAGFGNDKNAPWWGEQALIRALGTGLDTVNPNAAYKGSWNSVYDQNLERSQQAEIGNQYDKNQKAYGESANFMNDLPTILAGLGLVTGVGGLAGAFGGAGGMSAAGADAGVLGYGTGDVALNGLGGVAASGGGAVGGFVAPEAVGGTVSGSGGETMFDWADPSTWGDLGGEVPYGPGIGDGAFTGGVNGEVPYGPGINDGATIPTSTSGTPSWLSQLSKAPTSLLKSLGMSDSDISSIGKLAAAGLGAYASNSQANALADVAKQYAEYGAPYRAELARLQSDPGSFLTSPRVTTAVDQGTGALARALSAKDGNPIGSGRALQELQNYSTNSLYGQLANRENQLANFGGLSNFNAAAPSANLASVQQTGNMYNAIGAGINDVFNPQPTYLDLIKAMKGLT